MSGLINEILKQLLTCVADNFGELSIQTENFEKKLKTANGFSPEGLTNSSRSSSYSSIVSSSSTEGIKTKSPTDNKRYNLGFSPFGEQSIPSRSIISDRLKFSSVGEFISPSWSNHFS